MENLKLTKNEKKLDKRNYIILIGLILVYVIYRSYFKIDTIGHDYRYSLFVLLIPTISGIIILGYLKREFLTDKLNESKGVLQKGFLILLFLLQGFIFSYFSIGFVADAIWNHLNKKTADMSSAEIVSCELTGIYSGTSKSSPKVNFEFHGKPEHLTIDHKTYGQYFTFTLKDLKIHLIIRKGIWDFYIIDNWEIKTTAKNAIKNAGMRIR